MSSAPIISEQLPDERHFVSASFFFFLLFYEGIRFFVVFNRVFGINAGLSNLVGGKRARSSVRF